MLLVLTHARYKFIYGCTSGDFVRINHDASVCLDKQEMYEGARPMVHIVWALSASFHESSRYHTTTEEQEVEIARPIRRPFERIESHTTHAVQKRILTSHLPLWVKGHQTCTHVMAVGSMIRVFLYV